MDNELPTSLCMLIGVLVVTASLLHGFYAALFARFGLVNRRLLTGEDTAPRQG